MSYKDFLAGYQAWKEEEDRQTRSQSDKRAELPTAGSSAAKGETKKTGLPIAGNKNPYATYTRPSVSSPGLGTMLAPATVPQKTVDTLTPKTQQAQNDAQYNNWLPDLFGRYGTEAGESLAKGADAASRLVQKDASLGERAEAGFDLVKTGLEAGLKGATGGVTNLLDALAGREDTKEAAAAQLAADTTVDDYLGKKLTDVQRQAAIDLLNRYKAENPDIWKADPTTLPEAKEAELAKYRQLDKQLGWVEQTADRLDKGARAIWNNLAATPDVLLETGKAAALNLADNLRNEDWLAALGDAWAGAGYDDVQAMTDEEVRQDAARRAEVAQRLQETGADRTMDLDTEGAQRMQRAAELQQQAKQGLSGGAALGYDVGMAVADNLVTLPLAAIPGVGGGLVLGVQGAKAAAQEANDLAQRGISADEALLRGAVSGGIEAATEKIGLDNIMDIVGKGGKAALNSLFKDGLQQLAKKGGSSAVGRAVAGVLSNMSAEALEETASYVANYAAAEAFGDPEAEFSIEELAYSALIGGLSGGVLGGGANVLNAITGRGKTAGAQADQQQSTSEAAPEAPGADITSPQGGGPAGVDLTQLYPETQPAVEQRNQGVAGNGFDIRQLYPEAESETVNTDNTAVDDNPETHTADELARIEEYKKAADPGLANFYEAVLNGEYDGVPYTVGMVNDRAAQAIQDLTGMDVRGNAHVLDDNGVHHIENRHGAAGEADSTMAEVEDVSRARYVLDNFDEAYLDKGSAAGYFDKNGKRAPVVVFSKKIDGSHVVVEAACDGKRKRCYIITEYISRNGVDAEKMAKSWHPRDAYQSTPAATSETETPVTSPSPVYHAGAGTVNGFDIRALYPGAQQPAAEQRNRGEAGSGFDIQQLYSDKEQPSSPASPSILKGEQVDALLPADQRNTLEQFASSKGLQVQYINDPDSPVSGSIQGNTMTINLGNGSCALGTAIHEVGHAMKAGDGKAFVEFQAAVLRLADTDPGLRRVAAGIVDAYLGDTSPARASMLNEDGSINRAALNEEVALKLAEELVQDPEQLIRTVSQDRTLIARFLDFVRKIKNSVSIRFTGSQKAMLDEAERTLENMLRGQAGEVSGQRLSIEQDVNGDPFVNITEDILEGVPEREKINTVKKVLRERFPDGFTWNGWKIGLTMPGINEFTRSRYTQRLRNQSNRQMYNDKLRTAANLNEIVEIADNIRNETPNHPRNDNLRSFNRADVRIKVGENEYTAKVVTAILPSTKEIFYDIISLTPTKIRTSLKANQNTAYVVPSSAEMPSTSSIAAPGGIVNTQEEVSRNSDQTARSAAATSGDLKGIDQDNGTERQIASVPSERDLYPTDSVAQDEDIVNELSRITAEQRALREERNAWMDSAEVQELEERRKAATKEYGVLRLQQWKNATPEWQAYTAKRQEYNARAKALQDRADELTEALRGSRQVQEQADWEERQAQQAAYDRAVAESGLSVADYHRQSAASQFGTTDQFEAAGYILPNGQMLDFSGPEKTRRSQDHREIESVFGPAELGRNADSTTALNQFIAEGNVRVMAESPGVDISGEVRPSAAQLDAIRRMADTLGADRQGFNLDISDNTGKVVASKWYTGHVRGERVINDIRAFYETGSLPQDSGLSGFHSLRTKGGVNLNGARTLDEYIAQKYGSQPAAPTATEAEAPVSDASPAAEPAASSDTEDAAPALERTAKSQSIQRRQESQFVRELGDLFGIPEGESRAHLRQLATQLADQRRTTGSIDPALADSIFEEAYQQGRVIEEQFYNDHKALKDELRTTAVTLDAESRNSAEYRDLRRSAMGRVRLTNEGGVPVDVRYMELSQQYPGLFPESIINPLEQARKMVEVAASIRRSESSLESYLGEDAEIFRQDARLRFDEAVNELTDGVDKVRRLEEDTARQTAAKRPAMPKPMTVKEIGRIEKEAGKLERKANRIMERTALTEADKKLVQSLLDGNTKAENLKPDTPNLSDVLKVYEARKVARDVRAPIAAYHAQVRQARAAMVQDMLEGTEQWTDKIGGKILSGLRYSMETMERNVRDISRRSGEAGKRAAQQVIQVFENVHKHEAASAKWKNRWRAEIGALNLNQAESEHVQLLGELYGLQAAEEMGLGRSQAEIEAVTEAERQHREQFQDKMDMSKVERAVPVFREAYDTIFQQINEAYIKNGYKPMEYRQGYFPHFTQTQPDGLLRVVASKLGISVENDSLPTDIAGLTYQFRPGRRWNPAALTRQGYETTYDAVKGFDRYLEVAADVIHHTEDIQMLRALEDGIRYKYGDEGLRQQMDEARMDENLTDEQRDKKMEELRSLGKSHLSNFVQELNEYTNLLAGKKSGSDRPVEKDFGRVIYQTMNNLESRVAANMVAVNPGSWLTNFIPIMQAVGESSPRSLLQAGFDTIKAMARDDGFADQSVFLTNRRGSEPLSMTGLQRLSRKLSSPMQIIDDFTSNVVTRAKYMDNVRAGMDQVSALENADRYAANLMADRSKGALPTVFGRKNPLTRLLTMYQVEVNNQFRYLFKDLPDDLKDEGIKAIAAALLKIAVASYLFNDLYELVVGRRSALDPIDIANEAVGDALGVQLPNTFAEAGRLAAGNAGAEDFQTDQKGASRAVVNAGKNMLEQAPFVGSVLGGGRIPISSAVPDVGKVFGNLIGMGTGEINSRKAQENIAGELWKPVFYMGFPVAGGQVKRMIEGASTIIGGGSYTLNSEGEKQLQFAVENPTAGDWLTALTFGKWALPGGREYVENFQKKNVGYTQAYEAGYSTSILDQLYPGSGKGAGEVTYSAMLPDQEDAAQVDSWLEKLYGSTDNKSVLPSNSTTSFTVDGEKVDLSGPEALEYAQDRQTVGYEILSLFKAPESRPLDVQEQYAVYAQDYAAEVAKAEATGIPPKETSWVAKVQQLAGVSGTEVTDDLIDVLTARAIIANTEGRKQPNGKEIQGSRRRNVLEALRTEGYTTDEAIRLYEALA